MDHAEKGVVLDAIRDSKVDFHRRRIFLIGEIDEEMAEQVITAIHVLDETNGSIYLTMMSSGGEEPSGYAIYDALVQARSLIIIECYGQVSSIAAAILQAADVRRLAPNCDFMIHNGGRGSEAKEWIENNEIQKLARDIERDNDRYRGILYDRAADRRNSTVTHALIRQWCDQETYFTAEEAIANGFADEIITSKKRVTQ